MADDTTLSELVLGYCRQLGALVEPPAYGVYEVLLPEAVAARWRLDPFQRFSFTSGETDGSREVTRLNYGHPLVEEIIDELRQQAANTHFYINSVRLEKPGLFGLIEKSLQFPNARLFAIPKAQEKPALYDTVRFNFKVSLISDEKRELVKPVWMNLQGGYAVDGTEIEHLAILERENGFRSLEGAALAWMGTNATKTALTPPVMNELLKRASRAMIDELAPILGSMESRMRRFLELDRARLQGYYDDLEKDLKKRIQRASGDRRSALEEKLAAVAAERQIKLADAEQKYRIQVELELINLALFSQPKIGLQVKIQKRTSATERRVVWDPLLHRLEPLTCDVCGLPGENLWLCEEGHLAHADCLAPQCVDCKRTYCKLCADKIHRCAVCEQPVCVQSLNRCKTCGRETCQSHAELCHAQDGEPMRMLPQAQPAEISTQETSSEKETKAEAPKTKTETGPSPRPLKKKEVPKPKPSSTKKTTGRNFEAISQQITGQAMEVYVSASRPEVSAYIFRKGRQLAARHWELVEDGILVECACEKGLACRANNIIHRPLEANEIENQVQKLITYFGKEYQVPVKKISYFREGGSKSVPMYRFTLFGSWKDPEVLKLARRQFDLGE